MLIKKTIENGAIIYLNSPFTKEEVQATINLMPTNKSPGPDGFSNEFYRGFWTELHPIFFGIHFSIAQKWQRPFKVFVI